MSYHCKRISVPRSKRRASPWMDASSLKVDMRILALSWSLASKSGEVAQHSHVYFQQFLAKNHPSWKPQQCGDRNKVRPQIDQEIVVASSEGDESFTLLDEERTRTPEEENRQRPPTPSPSFHDGERLGSKESFGPCCKEQFPRRGRPAPIQGVGYGELRQVAAPTLWHIPLKESGTKASKSVG